MAKANTLISIFDRDSNSDKRYQNIILCAQIGVVLGVLARSNFREIDFSSIFLFSRNFQSKAKLLWAEQLFLSLWHQCDRTKSGQTAKEIVLISVAAVFLLDSAVYHVKLITLDLFGALIAQHFLPKWITLQIWIWMMIWKNFVSCDTKNCSSQRRFTTSVIARMPF